MANRKGVGAVYTPPGLARFMADAAVSMLATSPVRPALFDPAAGDGELLLAGMKSLAAAGFPDPRPFFFEIDDRAADRCVRRVAEATGTAPVRLGKDFLSAGAEARFDLVLANPPYVRSKDLPQTARDKAREEGLPGRADLFQMFLARLPRFLSRRSSMAVVVPGSLLSSAACEKTRQSLAASMDIRLLADFGETGLFPAAVLPVVFAGVPGQTRKPAFWSVSRDFSADAVSYPAKSPEAMVGRDGPFSFGGKGFVARAGRLADPTAPSWSCRTADDEKWLARLASGTWKTFGDVLDIRVGVKTNADKVFMPESWDGPVPELARPVTTHHAARRWVPKETGRTILYPHAASGGRTVAVDPAPFPVSEAWLSANRARLESRDYLIRAKREWFEIWNPRDASLWDRPKLVFNDIAPAPCFWLDPPGTVVNGDCYFAVHDDKDLLLLSMAVANSSVGSRFYDIACGGRLLGGRKRFMPRHVSRFPLPDPSLSREVIRLAASLVSGSDDGEDALDAAVAAAFGLP